MFAPSFTRSRANSPPHLLCCIYLRIADALSSGEEAQRGVGEETRNSKRLKTKHSHKKNTNSNNNDNEIEHTKPSKDKNTRLRSDSTPEHLERNVNGGISSGNEDTDGGRRKQEALSNMEKIEKEFIDLKEKLFKDKIGQLKKEVDSIKNGTSLTTQTPAINTSELAHHHSPTISHARPLPLSRSNTHHSQAFTNTHFSLEWRPFSHEVHGYVD